MPNDHYIPVVALLFYQSQTPEPPHKRYDISAYVAAYDLTLRQTDPLVLPPGVSQTIMGFSATAQSAADIPGRATQYRLRYAAQHEHFDLEFPGVRQELTRLHRRWERIIERFGPPGSFGQYVLRFADMVGVPTFFIPDQWEKDLRLRKLIFHATTAQVLINEWIRTWHIIPPTYPTEEPHAAEAAS